MDHPLAEGAELCLTKSQSNYLLNVLRLKEGADLLVFNGREGEWQARLALMRKKVAMLTVIDQTRPQGSAPRLIYWFAPLKHARLDYLVQKATEMGVGRFQPTLTAHTQTSRLNLERMSANIIEACEQCGVLSLPQMAEPKPLEALVAAWAEATPHQPLFFCDERADPVSATSVLAPFQERARESDFAPACLIGPEGGFSKAERDLLRRYEFVQVLPLGPRILRADTAAVAALTLIQAHLGDWLVDFP